MLNFELYERNPLQHELANNGVAQVEQRADEERASYEKTLRFELENFVCDGEYQQGLERLLQSFLDRLKVGEQPSPAWLSGFFGAGKSHLAKMLGALWANYEFLDGAKALTLATHVPTSVKDLLQELHRVSRRYGGLQTLTGLMAADGSSSAFATVLGIVFKSRGLPSQLNVGRFVLWLKEQGYHDRVAATVEASGEPFRRALLNFAASSGIRKALLECDPGLGDEAEVRRLLREQFLADTAINKDRFVQDVERVLTLDRSDTPLTLLVLDEVQQYLDKGDDDRSLQVQAVAEACQSGFKGRVQLLATGQSAMGSTETLEKLKGRFPLTVHLTDADVEGVIRKTVLHKALTHQGALQSKLDAAAGEISRHLAGSRIAPAPKDAADLVGDYPILPSRRRFFEEVLRAIDATGVVSQLRNQLRIAYEAAKKTAQLPVGNVIGGDYIFDELQTSSTFQNLISNELLSAIRKLEGSADADDRLKARIMKLVFVINQLPSDAATGAGVRPDESTLADLLVTDLTEDSSALRAQLPALLKELQDVHHLLMALDENGRRVYRENTAESASWYADFKQFEHELRSARAKIDAERADELRTRVRSALSRIKTMQGAMNVARKLDTTFEHKLPATADEQLTVWVQDGWATGQKAFEADALAAGIDSATLFVFVPERDKADLNDALVELHAAKATLEKRRAPQTPQGVQAQNMMELRRKSAQDRVDEILSQAVSEALVLAGGGAPVDGADLTEKVQAGVAQSLPRLFHKFAPADHKDWAKVFAKAGDGAADALKFVDHAGDASAHPVCKELASYIGATGKKGADLQDRFEKAPYGWPRDAIQGATLVLLANGVLKAQDAAGAAVQARQIERNQFTKTTFQTEKAQVSAKDRLAVGAVLTKAGIKYGAGEEGVKVALLGMALSQKRLAAGGEAPLPALSAADLIADIEKVSGNDQLLVVASRKADIVTAIDSWDDQAAKIRSRLPAWEGLNNLLLHASACADFPQWQTELEAIKTHRALLGSPDPVAALFSKVQSGLRDAVNDNVSKYSALYASERSLLEADAVWGALDAAKREELLTAAGLPAKYEVKTGTAEALLDELTRCSLARWDDRIAAIPQRFAEMRKKAVQLLEPKSVSVQLPRRLLRTEEEVRAWLAEVETVLVSTVKENPVQL